MADLKAAANSIRNNWSNDMDFLKNAPISHVLAAQALEAWAWVEKTDAILQPFGLQSDWRIEVNSLKYYADTPLGCVLAAMEGEKNEY